MTAAELRAFLADVPDAAPVVLEIDAGDLRPVESARVVRARSDGGTGYRLASRGGRPALVLAAPWLVLPPVDPGIAAVLEESDAEFRRVLAKLDDDRADLDAVLAELARTGDGSDDGGGQR